MFLPLFKRQGFLFRVGRICLFLLAFLCSLALGFRIALDDSFQVLLLFFLQRLALFHFFLPFFHPPLNLVLEALEMLLLEPRDALLPLHFRLQRTLKLRVCFRCPFCCSLRLALCQKAPYILVAFEFVEEDLVGLLDLWTKPRRRKKQFM